jgi:hypothetical protein
MTFKAVFSLVKQLSLSEKLRFIKWMVPEKMGEFSQAGFLMLRAVADNHAVISSFNTIS